MLVMMTCMFVVRRLLGCSAGIVPGSADGCHCDNVMMILLEMSLIFMMV